MIFLAINWPHVLFVTILGFALVLVLLVVLIYVLKLFGHIMHPHVMVDKPQEVHPVVGTPHEEEHDNRITLTGDATAAIAMELHLYFNGIHDEEPTHVTIKRIERKYSPWNAKIMGMNNLHRN